MKHLDEYRDKELIMKLVSSIKRSATGNYTFMEVCGGHTASIQRFGIPAILPPNIRLISGPGCPVCVTGTGFIDKAIAYSQCDEIIVATFGDMLRVPGSSSTLEKERSKGADIRMVFSALEAVELAKNNPVKKVVFLGIGFETTAPGSAVAVKNAYNSGINNFYLLSAHKIMPPAMEAIIKEGAALDGFICPGHVAAITGSSAFSFIPEKYGLGCVVTGFEPADILQSIYMLVNQVNNNHPDSEIQYIRAVTESGNLIAQKILEEVFEKSDENWRGFGKIPLSGLKLRENFSKYDAGKILSVTVNDQEENVLCICCDILRGLKSPVECQLFGETCVPDNPVGACMVSSEGACNSYFKYRLND